MVEKVMYFRDPTFKKGDTNVTIRRGDKWNSLVAGDRITFLEVGTAHELGQGTVKECFYGKYDELPDVILGCNQESINEMYTDFEESEYVTVVIFEVD